MLLNFLKDKIENFGNSFQTWNKNALNSKSKKNSMLLIVSKLLRLVSYKSRVQTHLLVTRVHSKLLRDQIIPNLEAQNKKMILLNLLISLKSQYCSEDTRLKQQMTARIEIQKIGVFNAKI